MDEQNYRLLLTIRGTGELTEIESENADSIRDTLCNIYTLSARNKSETRLLFDALFQRSLVNTRVDLIHRIAVQPGDTANGLCTQYKVVMCATGENCLSIEDIALALQEIPATTSPSQCWVTVTASLIKTLGGTKGTEIALINQTKVGKNTVEIAYEMYGPIFQQAEKLSFHENENMQLESVVDGMRANIALTEEKLVQLTSDNPDEFPVSLVFRYFTYGIQWNFSVSLRDGRFVSIRAMDNNIAIQAKSGNLVMYDSMRPFTDTFVHTRENWKHALRTAVALVDADSVGEIVQMTRVVECLAQHRWGQSLLTRFLP